jgi:very-short-patch-repair endonuclease
MTKAEACLWKYALRAKQMGYTFNRQRPVLNYIADFMCKEFKLIIEVDGVSHLFEEVIKKDLITQNELEKAGFKVLRFRDEEILKEISRVREVILTYINSIEQDQ